MSHSERHPWDANNPYPETHKPKWGLPMERCACVRDDALDCAQARYGDTDESCDCGCHDQDEIDAGAHDVYAGDPE